MTRNYSLVLTLAACRFLCAADALPAGEAVLDERIEVTGNAGRIRKKTSEISSR